MALSGEIFYGVVRWTSALSWPLRLCCYTPVTGLNSQIVYCVSGNPAAFKEPVRKSQMFRVPAYDPVAIAVMGFGIFLAAALVLSF
jgi:hypothetical protein